MYAIRSYYAEAVKEKNLEPLARIVSYGWHGCDPAIMGIGPVEATRVALKKAGWSMGDLDLIEANEAFAAQCMAVGRDLAFPAEKLNPSGGARNNFV